MNSLLSGTSSSLNHSLPVSLIVDTNKKTENSIDVGVFFEKRNAKINEPIENILK